jgi:choline dehydrogenase-like flavoprotein
MSYDHDIIVIGSGAGGATLAATCAAAGKDVLVLERGPRHSPDDAAHDEWATLVERRPYSDLEIEVNGRYRRPYVGGGAGGSTALYGAALVRPSPDDFHPGRHYGPRLPRAIWDWPVGYDDLEPFYTEAEQLFGVAGAATDDFGPLARPRRGFPAPPRPLEPINRRLVSANRACGLKPFHLPLAIDFGRCLGCGSCPGFLCPTGARRSAVQLVDAALASGARLRLQTGAEAECLLRDGRGEVTGVQVRERATGLRVVYRARLYVLAAGALGSPVLLLRSGLDGPLVGRNYMFHLAPLVAGVFRQPTGAEDAFVKQVGFSDYYFGSRRYAHKLGLIQSLPVPGPLMLAQVGLRRLPASFVDLLRRRLLPLVGIVEDLPNPDNQVSLGPDGIPRLRHAFASYDLERGWQLGRFMARILKRAGALFCVAKAFASDEHLAHHCGTLRFGASPANAVLDPDCRLFGQPNVFVVDGSCFPTSLGVGPALTIIANALRVARVVLREV